MSLAGYNSRDRDNNESMSSSLSSEYGASYTKSNVKKTTGTYNRKEFSFPDAGSLFPGSHNFELRQIAWEMACYCNVGQRKENAVQAY